MLTSSETFCLFSIAHPYFHQFLNASSYCFNLIKRIDLLFKVKILCESNSQNHLVHIILNLY